MRAPESFFWLAAQSVGHVYFLVPTAVCLGAAMLIAGSKRCDWARARRGDLRLLLLPTLIGLLILGCGAAFASERSRPSELGQWLVTALFFLVLPITGWIIYRLAGVRTVAIFLLLPQVWFAGWAFFNSIMSVTGVWL